jgi:CheY-like chemotaxis protein
LALKSKLIVKLARRALGRAGRPAPGEPLAPVDAPLLQAAVTPRGSDSVIWPSSLEQPGAEVRRAAMRVLVISRDRHFRSVTSMLLSHRGCSVTTTAEAVRVAETVSRERADVVVVDACHSTAGVRALAELGALPRRVGLVVVDEGPTRLQRLPVLAKWGPFVDLLAAIERADRDRGGGVPSA